ncbi:hypothetical protein ABFB09_01595 [Dehalogenimonas sp. THU2]|uniref:hypothetical protein n=1 Tax=Dehalogenimonas sp. THU2 TaxID=3151121 RepID=UPI003218939A
MNKENNNSQPNPEETPAPRGVGAPKGNQNARTHGFYSKKCDDARRAVIEEAGTVEGLDAEIALIRAKIQLLEQKDPDNVKLFLQAINTLSNVMIRRRYAGRGDWQTLTDAVQRAFKGVVVPAAAIREALGK